MLLIDFASYRNFKMKLNSVIYFLYEFILYEL